MKRVPPLLGTQVWGALAGAALGAARTREAALHLLAKNHALEVAGIPALPGIGHVGTLASWAPAGAGALFFGLSLGLGWGSLLGLGIQSARMLPGRAGHWAPWASLAVPLAALPSQDLGLSAFLLAAAAGALWCNLGARGDIGTRALCARLALVAVLLAGTLPWITATEGAFTRLRDRYLLSTAPGRALDRFYYRWTLYPAEVLKPLGAKTQPTVCTSSAVPSIDARRFCHAALGLRILCLPSESPGADARLDRSGGGLALTRGAIQVPWPSDPKGQGEAWKEFSRRADGARSLRRATALGLFLGCPLALCWALASLAIWFGSRFPGRRAPVAAIAAALALAALLALAGRSDPALREARRTLFGTPRPSLEAVTACLRSPNTAERFYAARAASRLGPPAAPLLLEAVSDPSINVRYAAAQALGSVDGAEAEAVLREVLRNPEEWYVKERAYSALWRLGWRPR